MQRPPVEEHVAKGEAKVVVLETERSHRRDSGGLDAAEMTWGPMIPGANCKAMTQRRKLGDVKTPLADVLMDRDGFGWSQKYEVGSKMSSDVVGNGVAS